MSATAPIQPASEPPAPLVPREWRLRLDPLLALAFGDVTFPFRYGWAAA